VNAYRTILHLDMDAFYASVEQRDKPELRGLPVIVGGKGGRGVVTTASYEARKFGCRSAMPMAQAMRLCPQAVVVPVDMARYVAVSRQVREILETVTPDVEPLSIDEAFLDVSGVVHLHPKLGSEPFAVGVKLAHTLREKIQSVLRLPASVGVAASKFVAKVASDLAKPNGVFAVEPGREIEVLGDLPVGVIYTLGPKAQEKLAKRGVRTVRELRGLGEAALEREFGEVGLLWWRFAHGIDERSVVTDRESKSTGKERTFSTNVSDPAEMRSLLLGFVEDVTRELRRDGLECRGVTVKLRTPDFKTATRSGTLDGERFTDLTDEVWVIARGLLDGWLKERGRGDVSLRLLGVQVHDLRPKGSGQLGLFSPAQADPGEDRKRKVDSVSDAIAARFGKGSIRRGGSA
jgi:DNA polymerase-4